MEALCSYLPASILSFLLERQGAPLIPPCRQTYKTAVLFADISGYTALCEAVASKGAGGDEYLAKHLNSYFEQLVRIMSSQGGDVFKFAGDAVLVLWPPGSDEDLTTLTRRAAQCGLEIKRGLQAVALAPGITLSVKIGVGVGEVSILHVGGVFSRMEYVAAGRPLQQAFLAEHHCTGPDVVASPEAWSLISPYFESSLLPSGHALLIKSGPGGILKKVNVAKTMQAMSLRAADSNVKEEVLKNVGKYVPSAVIPFINHHEEKWASELRRITVLFVNLGLREEDMNQLSGENNGGYISLVHEVLQAVQRAVYKYEGSLNKFLMDDKGSTLIAVFGLPPLAHEDDSVRGVLAALAICAKLHELGYLPCIGVTTGHGFCGVVGSHSRREYSVLGDTVNLAARLMQHATTVLGGGILADTATQYSARHRLHFEELPPISVKGKSKPVALWQPYSHVLAPLYQKKKEGISSAPLSPASVTSRSSAAQFPVVTDLSPRSSTRGGPFSAAGNTSSAAAAASAASSSSSASAAATSSAANSAAASSSAAAALLQSGGAGLLLVDDETLHLRRKSSHMHGMELSHLVRMAPPPSVAATSAAGPNGTSDAGTSTRARGSVSSSSSSPAHARTDSLTSNGAPEGTSDTIDPASVASLHGAAARGGAALARTVDGITELERMREGESSVVVDASSGVAAAAAAAADSALAAPASTHSRAGGSAGGGIISPAAAAHPSQPSSGASTSSSAASTAASGTLLNTNTPLGLMHQIHNFQMSGHAQRHFSELRQRRASSIIGSAQRGQSLLATASGPGRGRGSSVGAESDRTTNGGHGNQTRPNSMDAAVHSTSPAAAFSISPPHTAVHPLQLHPSAHSASSSAAPSAAVSPSADGDDTILLPPGFCNVHLRAMYLPAVWDNISEGIAPSIEECVARTSVAVLESKRVRGVRVLLPDGAGHVTLSTLHLESVLQLKEELSILCRKRQLLPPGSSSHDYFLALEDDHLWEAAPTSAAAGAGAAGSAQGWAGDASSATPIGEDLDAHAHGNTHDVATSSSEIELDSPHSNATTLIDDVLGPVLERQRAKHEAYRLAHGIRTSTGGASMSLSRSRAASATFSFAGAGAAAAHHAPLPPAPVGRYASNLNSPASESQNADGVDSLSPPNGTSSSATLLSSLLSTPESDLVSLCLLPSRPDYLIDVLPRKLHDVLLHAIHVKLLQERRGGTIVVEGDVGLGKTHLVMGALQAAQALAQREIQAASAAAAAASANAASSSAGSNPVSSPASPAPEHPASGNEDPFALLCSLANPFEMNKPLSCWRDIFLTAIDLELERAPQEQYTQQDQQPLSPGHSVAAAMPSQSLLRARRRAFISSKLCLRRSPLPGASGRDSLDSLAPVLNEVLQLDFPETAATQNMDPAARIAHAQNILLLLMQLFVSGSSGAGSSTGVSSGAAASGFASAASTPRHGHGGRFGASRQGSHASASTTQDAAQPPPSAAVVVCIDDAVFLDLWSWSLVLRMSREVRGLLLILVTRPMNRTYQAAFASAHGVPTEFSLLRAEPQTMTLTLRNRTDQVIVQIAMEAFGDAHFGAIQQAQHGQNGQAGRGSISQGAGSAAHNGGVMTASNASSSSFAGGNSNGVASLMINCPPSGRVLPSLPADLAHLLLTKAHGSPLVVLELVYNLKKSQLCTLEFYDAHSGEIVSQDAALADEYLASGSLRARVRVSPRFDVLRLHANPLIPVPITLQNILGCRIDRLTHCQRMLLKCAAVIGDRWDSRIVKRVYPLALDDPERDLSRELAGLVDLHIVRIVEQPHQMGQQQRLQDSPAGSMDLSGAASPGVVNTGSGGSGGSGSDLVSLDSASSPEAISVPIAPAIKYSFADGFMREMFLSRMLDAQKASLEEKVCEVRLDLFKRRAESVLRGMAGGGGHARGGGGGAGISGAGAGVQGSFVPFFSAVLYVRDQPPAAAAHSDGDRPEDGTSEAGALSNAASSGSSSTALSSTVAASTPPLEYRLRYFALAEGLLLGWATEEQFLERREPICMYSLEDAATCENPEQNLFGAPTSHMHAWAQTGVDPQLSFVIRSAVCMDRFSAAGSGGGNQAVYSYHSPTLIYLAALNEKEYDEWGVHLHRQISEKLVLPPPAAALSHEVSAVAAADGAGSLGQGSSMSLPPPGTGGDASAEHSALDHPGSRSGAGSGRESQRGSLQFQANPLQQHLHHGGTGGASMSVGGAAVGGMLASSASQGGTAGGGTSGATGSTSHSAHNSPHTSFSIPASGSHALAHGGSSAAAASGGTSGVGAGGSSNLLASPASSTTTTLVAAPQDVATLTPLEKEVLAKKFITAVESRLAPQILPPMLMHVKKLRVTQPSSGAGASPSSSDASASSPSISAGSLFTSEWKARYVTLIDEALVFRDRKFGAGFKWTRPTQCFSLAVGSPAAWMAPLPAQVYDQAKKVYKMTLETDLWMKAGSLSWTRRSVVLGLPSLEAARELTDAINEAIFKNQVTQAQLSQKQKHQRASTWGNAKNKDSSSASGSAAGGASTGGVPGTPAQGPGRKIELLAGGGGGTGAQLPSLLGQNGGVNSGGGGPVGSPIMSARSSARNSLNTNVSASKHHHHGGHGQGSLSHASKGSFAVAGADEERKSLRASQRQLNNNGMSIVTSSSPAASPGPGASPSRGGSSQALLTPATPANAPPGLGSVAPPPTPNSAGHAASPLPQPSGDVVQEAHLLEPASAQRLSARPHFLSMPPLHSPASNASPNTAGGGGGASVAQYPASPGTAGAGFVSPLGVGGLLSPMYPTTPSSSHNHLHHSGSGGSSAPGSGSGGNGAGASTQGEGIAEEERQFDALFAEALAGVDASWAPVASSSASNTVALTPSSAHEQVRALLQSLQSKVQNIARTHQRTRRTQGAGGAAGGSAGGASDGSPLSAGVRGALSPHRGGDDEERGEDEAEAEDTADPSAFGFTEMVSACDLDDNTRSWLQLNYTAAAEQRAEEGEQQQQQPQPQLQQDAVDGTEVAASSVSIGGATSLAAALPGLLSSPPATTAPSSSSTIVVGASNAASLAAQRLALSSPPSLEGIGDITQWEWCIFDHAASDSSALLPVVYAIFVHFDFLKMYNIEVATFRAWAQQVCAEYFDCPFHNFFHAVDVLQTAFALLTSHGGAPYLNGLERFALLIAALCHDLRHPGLSNLYHVNARTPLAMLYNDQSVLEHHHASTCFRIMDRPERNILKNLSMNEYRHVRMRLTQGILATDMTGHFGLIEKFNSFLDEQARLPANNPSGGGVAEPSVAVGDVHSAGDASGSSPAPPQQPSPSPPLPVFQTAKDLSDATRAVLFNSLLHCADISNPAKPWATQRRWSDAVLAEFLRQGDMEKARGLPVSPNCDRDTTDQALLSLNFIDFIVAPIFVSLRHLLPSLRLCCGLLRSNRAQWSALFAEGLRANTKLSATERAAELARATRRTESFHESMLLDDAAAAQAENAHASEDHCPGPAHGGSSLPATPDQRHSHLAAPAHATPSSFAVSSPHRDSFSGGGGGAGSASPLSGGSSTQSPSPTHAATGPGYPPHPASSSSAPSSFSTPSSRGDRRRLAPSLSDPRRNSMLMLRKFTQALGPSRPRGSGGAQTMPGVGGGISGAGSHTSPSPMLHAAPTPATPPMHAALTPTQHQQTGSPAMAPLASAAAPAAAALSTVSASGTPVRHYSVQPRSRSQRNSGASPADGSAPLVTAQAASQLRTEPAPAQR